MAVDKKVNASPNRFQIDRNFFRTTNLKIAEERGCPSLVGGRIEPKPAKPVVLTGRAGSNPAPRAIPKGSEELVFDELSLKAC